MPTKTKINKPKEIKPKTKKEEHSEELVQEVKEALEDYKKGRYVKGDVKDIMKAIREYKDETN
ncbi:MAG: hypothetical protein M3R36_11200 [Bacteroidota bacterium]|nr:hypothetical protein [Bacteroidota bacterium]